MTAETVNASQVRRPWRATLRTTLQALLALALMLPLLVDAAGLDETAPPIAGAIALAAAFARVMALPAVEAFLRQFVPWLAAEPRPVPGDDTGHTDVVFLIGITVAAACGVILAVLVLRAV